MKKTVSQIMLVMLFTSMLALTLKIQPVKSTQEPPVVEWSKTYGGSNVEEARSVIQTSDGGHALAGYTNSFGAGDYDFWLVKTDALGNVQWNKTYGSTGDEWGFKAIQTSDGGYAFVGTMWNQSRGAEDLYMVKTDENGTLLWDLDYIADSTGGGADWGDVRYIIQADDGNYVLCGSVRHHPLHSTYDWDAWVIKVDTTGHVLWDNPYFSGADDGGGGIVQTTDGGYAFVGATGSWGGSGGVIWLVKIDANGTDQWTKTYGSGGGPTDNAFAVIQTPDEGYTIAGFTFRFGATGCDSVLIKTDSSGNMVWVKTYGGANEEQAHSMVATAEGGYLFAGFTKSFGAGASDFWLVETDPSGNMKWNETYGGVNDDGAWSIIKTNDDSYAVAGYTYSFGAGASDFCLIRLAAPEHRTWIVDDDGPADFHTIQEAIDHANKGDTIYVKSGTYYEHIIINKTLTLVGEDRDGTIVDGTGNGQIMYVWANNVSISNFTLQNSGFGPYGAIAVRSLFSNVRIFNNTMINNRHGVAVESNALNVTVVNNLIFNKQPSYADGIRLFSTETVVIGNIVMNESTAIGLDWAYDNIIRANTISNNYIGIGAGNPSYNNTFSDNTISRNSFGFLIAMYNSRFFHNNLVNNSVQATFYSSYIGNSWDAGYPSGGNYWSDHSGVDVKSGPYQNETGSDGIGDTPYTIDANNVDHYPLISQFPPPEESTPPVADFIWSPRTPIASELTTFDASSSKNGWNGTASMPLNSFTWDFGDNSTAVGQLVTHTYTSSGNYSVRLNVTDVQGLWNTAEKQIQVGQPLSPEAAFTASPEVVQIGKAVEFNASSSLPGWNGTNTMPIVEYDWSFGDHNATSTNDSMIIHSFAFPGTFNVTLTIFDLNGMNSSCSKWILVIMPTFVSVSTSSTSTVLGFAVSVNGTLYDAYGNGLENQPVVLYYTFPGVSTWFPITSGITDSFGHYYVQWIPTATGTFTIKAEWVGNVTYIGTSNNVTLSSLPYMNRYIFSVESNSTVSTLAFNTTSWELSFTASGPNGTTGYVKVTIAKSLIENITNIRVYLDGNQTEYLITPTDDSWLLTFNYTHSTHRVAVDLNVNLIPEFPSMTILPLFMLLTIIVGVVLKRRKRNAPPRTRWQQR
jgi:hypothetical protein